MNGYLLDTSVALLAVTIPERLSAKIRKAVEQGPTFLSVIAYWEVMIKSMKGTLDIGDPRRWWDETIEALAVTPLFYRPEHVAALYSLPPIHQDPFDRALIAQAIVEDLTLLTTDGTLTQYASRDFKVIR